MPCFSEPLLPSKENGGAFTFIRAVVHFYSPPASL